MDLNISQFGWIHTAISVVALLSGLVVVRGLLGSRSPGGSTPLFFVTAMATSLTGFGFAGGLGPAKIIGIISLVLLLIAGIARYAVGLSGIWRRIYAVAATFAVYFLVFVTIAETFKRVPGLKVMAPTLTETPFKAAQLFALAIFIVLAVFAAIRFRGADVIPA